MAQNRACNLSVTGRPSSPLRHVFKVPPDSFIRVGVAQLLQLTMRLLHRPNGSCVIGDLTAWLS
jgi:hypothetical protein